MKKYALIAVATAVFAALLVGGQISHAVDTNTVMAADEIKCAVLPDSICNAAKATPSKGDISDTGVYKLLVYAINILSAVIGIVAVGVLVYAGIMYASAGDNSQQVSSAKGMITNTVIGIIAYGLMYFALNWLIPGGVIG